VSEAENFPFIVKNSSNENKMKKQCKVFSIDEKNASISRRWRSRVNSGGSSGSAWFVGIDVKHDSE
jgi:hypothetical protein